MKQLAGSSLCWDTTKSFIATKCCSFLLQWLALTIPAAEVQPHSLVQTHRNTNQHSNAHVKCYSSDDVSRGCFRKCRSKGSEQMEKSALQSKCTCMVGTEWQRFVHKQERHARHCIRLFISHKYTHPLARRLQTAWYFVIQRREEHKELSIAPIKSPGQEPSSPTPCTQAALSHHKTQHCGKWNITSYFKTEQNIGWHWQCLLFWLDWKIRWGVSISNHKNTLKLCLCVHGDS